MVDTVTVIVPTKNEAANIGPFLESLPPAVCLVVVDDSEDETPEIIARLRPQNTRLLHLPGNITVARQEGAAQARTSWLLFTDADVVFAESYFPTLADSLTGDAIYGAKLSRDAYQDYYRRFVWGQRISDRLGIPAASGSNLIIRREVFQAIGGFDLSLTVNEDSEIAWRIKRNGYAIRFAENLVVYARDHRRLAKGTTRKTVHSLVRCSLLFTGLMPKRWRTMDWGYWANQEGNSKPLNERSKPPL